MKITIKTSSRKLLADTVTPVAMYLRLRHRFPGSLLLESSDYHGNEDSFSYICCLPAASIWASDTQLTRTYPDGTTLETRLNTTRELLPLLQDFLDSFQLDASGPKFPGMINGLFGYSTYDSVQFFEDIALSQKPPSSESIPLLRYGAFRYILAINHFRNELYIIENQFTGCSLEYPGIDAVLNEALNTPLPRSRGVELIGAEISNFSDEEHREIILHCKKHIARGDVFQLVFSRKFSQAYGGDCFHVYRALRSVNPSPYLFFFDYGEYCIFGSSPESQIIIRDGQATISPIAGTTVRTGDAARDLQLLEALREDPKENAEHVMLVDLARNDLSIHCDKVHVETYREVQQYSHVMHLVSKVRGTLFPGKSALSVFAATFPAGTLSGAPKYRAMEIIDQVERGARGFYGGAIGFFGFSGDCIHAIMIRSFLARQGRLHSQAGGGLVFDSKPEGEVQEVRNKLGALKKALAIAGEIGQ